LGGAFNAGWQKGSNFALQVVWRQRLNDFWLRRGFSGKRPVKCAN
jgi:hypothetical protein